MNGIQIVAKMKPTKQSAYNADVMDANVNEAKFVKKHNKTSTMQSISIGSNPTSIAINLYKCSICGASDIMEHNLIQHHSKVHGNIEFTANIFQLTGVTERDKCDLCAKYLKKGTLRAHKRRMHSQVRGDRVNRNTFPELVAQIDPVERVKRKQWYESLNGMNLVSKNTQQKKGSFKKHHSKTHVSNIPNDRIDFKLWAIKPKMTCDICGKRQKCPSHYTSYSLYAFLTHTDKRMNEGRSEKHHLKACLQSKLNRCASIQSENAIRHEVKMKQKATFVEREINAAENHVENESI